MANPLFQYREKPYPRFPSEVIFSHKQNKLNLSCPPRPRPNPPRIRGHRLSGPKMLSRAFKSFDFKAEIRAFTASSGEPNIRFPTGSAKDRPVTARTIKKTPIRIISYGLAQKSPVFLLSLTPWRFLRLKGIPCFEVGYRRRPPLRRPLARLMLPPRLPLLLDERL